MGVEIKGLESLRQKFNQLPKLLTDASYQATWEIAEEVLGNSQSRLASSIKFTSSDLLTSVKQKTEITSNGQVIGRVWSAKETATFREFGTGPVGYASPKDLAPNFTKIITYRTLPWLIPADEVGFDLTDVYGIPQTKIDGKTFFRTRGQPARPWLYPAFREVTVRTEEVFQRHIQAGVKRGLK